MSMKFFAPLLRVLSDLPMQRKFLIQTGLVAVGIVLLAIVAARVQFLDLNQTRKDGLAAQTQMALGIVEDYARRAEAGEMPLDEAQAGALRALSAMRANGGVDYFFVTDEQPTLLMHPVREDLVGKDVKVVAGSASSGTWCSASSP